MKINIIEDYLVLTNALYLPSLVIAFSKNIKLAIIGIMGIFIFSSEYHICYSPIHILANTHYNYQHLCLIDDIKFYGIIIMFFDVFFANFNAYILFVYLLIMNKGVYVRYMIMAFGLVIITLIAAYVGFFPDKSRQFTDVFAMIQYSQVHSDITDESFWNKLADMIVTLSQTEKSTFITVFTLFYTGSITLYYFCRFIYDKLTEDYYTEKFNKDMHLPYYCFRILKRYYQKRFDLLLLFLSISIGMTGLFIWIVIEGIFPHYYQYTHGFWHICTAVSYFLFLWSLKMEGFTVTVTKPKNSVFKNIKIIQ